MIVIILFVAQKKVDGHDVNIGYIADKKSYKWISTLIRSMSSVFYCLKVKTVSINTLEKLFDKLIKNKIKLIVMDMLHNLTSIDKIIKHYDD